MKKSILDHAIRILISIALSLGRMWTYTKDVCISYGIKILRAGENALARIDTMFTMTGEHAASSFRTWGAMKRYFATNRERSAGLSLGCFMHRTSLCM